MGKTIKVKYHGVEPIEVIDKGDWIDLRVAEDVDMKQGDFKIVSLGVSMQLPDGYEAHVLPRSSTFKKHGIILANGMGVIDESYCGDNDVWGFPAIAMRDTHIAKNTRIAQFRIVRKMKRGNIGDELIGNDFDYMWIEEVDSLGNEDRGGFGSTGTN